MSDATANKKVLGDFIQAVWREGNLDALPDFWTSDCVNHAAPEPDNRGLAALKTYHERFAAAFAAFSDVEIEIMRQIAEDDMVVTYLVMRATHAGPYFGLPPTGRIVSQATIRIDRLRDGKIAEHWSVADMAGLLRQIQS